MYDEKFEFVKHHHGYLNEYIRFADLKAAGIITANGLIIRLLYSALSNSIYETVHFFTFFGCSALVLSIILSLIVVLPRTSAKASKGLIFWENVNAMEKDEYIKKITDITQDALTQKLVEQNYFSAVTANRKYIALKRAFIVSFSGYFLLIIAGFIWFFY